MEYIFISVHKFGKDFGLMTKNTPQDIAAAKTEISKQIKKAATQYLNQMPQIYRVEA